MEHLRISPRHLGQMLLPDFCERCFFHQTHMNFKLPFDRPMPGLMFNLDNFEKRIVLAHLDECGVMPKWLEDLDCTSAVEFPSKMVMDFPEYDITLVGMPDAVFRKSNNKLYLIDWKTAICKGADDPFMPIYETQLLGYVHLLEHNKIGQVESAALVYFQNDLNNYSFTPLDLLTSQGFDVPFTTRIHEVEIDRSALDPLLKRIREFADMSLPPEGREKCKDCARLQHLLDAEVNRRCREDVARARDGYFRALSSRLERERQRAREACPDDSSDEEWLRVSDLQDSIPAVWDW